MVRISINELIALNFSHLWKDREYFNTMKIPILLALLIPLFSSLFRLSELREVEERYIANLRSNINYKRGRTPAAPTTTTTTTAATTTTTTATTTNPIRTGQMKMADQTKKLVSLVANLLHDVYFFGYQK